MAITPRGLPSVTEFHANDDHDAAQIRRLAWTVCPYHRSSILFELQVHVDDLLDQWVRGGRRRTLLRHMMERWNMLTGGAAGEGVRRTSARVLVWAVR